MSKEFQIEPGKDVRTQLRDYTVGRLAEYLETDADTTVSEAQMEAYRQVVDALPDGKIKLLAEKLKGVQGVSSKFNELMLGVQDKSWKLAKPIVTLRAPLAGVVPSEPFSKVAIKAAKLGGLLGVKVVTSAVAGGEAVKEGSGKLKNRVTKFLEDRKNKKKDPTASNTPEEPSVAEDP